MSYQDWMDQKRLEKIERLKERQFRDLDLQLDKMEEGIFICPSCESHDMYLEVDMLDECKEVYHCPHCSLYMRRENFENAYAKDQFEDTREQRNAKLKELKEIVR